MCVWRAIKYNNINNCRSQDILAKVEPGSVIVMDNAPYHSRQLDRLSNMGWRKAEIQEWLRVKEISFKEEETKAHLMAKIDCIIK